LRGQMLNIQSIVAAFNSNHLIAGLFAWLAAAALGFVWLRRQRAHGEFDFLDLAALSAITLLPLYHRDYDIILLLPGILWAINALIREGSPMAGGVLVTMIVFILPVEGILQLFIRLHHIPLAWESQTWW